MIYLDSLLVGSEWLFLLAVDSGCGLNSAFTVESEAQARQAIQAGGENYCTEATGSHGILLFPCVLCLMDPRRQWPSDQPGQPANSRISHDSALV